LVPLLQARRLQVRFEEARDGHNWQNWRDRMRAGLTFLFPGPFGWCTNRHDRERGHRWGRHTRIGLSLGADICWPRCFEALLQHLDLRIPWQGDTLRLRRIASRSSLRPYPAVSLRRRHRPADALVSHQREWIKKAVILDGLYVFNNPWSIQANEKHTTYAAMMRLGLKIPQTWMLPPKAYEQTADLQPTLERYARLFDLAAIGDKWLSAVHEALRRRRLGRRHQDRRRGGIARRYETSGVKVMHLQQGIIPYDRFVRCIGLGPQTRSSTTILPRASRPLPPGPWIRATGTAGELETITLTINAFFGWISIPAKRCSKATIGVHRLRQRLPRLAGNLAALPFPVAGEGESALVAVLCRDPQSMRLNLDWSRFFEAAAREDSYAGRIAAYGVLARRHFDADRFAEFCAKHLGHLDAWRGSFSAVSRRARRCAPRYLRSIRRTRSSGLRALLGAHPGVAPARACRAADEQAILDWESQRLPERARVVRWVTTAHRAAVSDRRRRLRGD